MPLSLLPTKAALAVNIEQPFEGVGGVAPYAYSLVTGVGSIHPTTGVYTAPNTVPAADDPPTVVRVTDANLDTSDVTIKILTPLELLCDIIQTELALADGRVYLWDQKIFEPTDFNLFVVVGVMGSKPFANIRQFSPGSGLDCVQSIHVLDMLSIDIISRGPAARDRKEEILLAVNSFYSQQQQELNSFKLGILSKSFNDLSNVDGAAIPYRFNISLNIQYSVTKSKAVEYYDDFSDAEVTVDP